MGGAGIFDAWEQRVADPRAREQKQGRCPSHLATWGQLEWRQLGRAAVLQGRGHGGSSLPR